MAGQRGGASDADMKELIMQLKRIFSAMQGMTGGGDRGPSDPQNWRAAGVPRSRPLISRRFMDRHVASRGRGALDAVRSATAASPTGFARGAARVIAGSAGTAASGLGAGMAAGMVSARFSGERLARMSDPNRLQSVKSAELQRSVVEKVTLGMGGGHLKAAFNASGYTDVLTAAKATKDDVMGLARSAFESGTMPKKEYLQSMAKVRYKKNKQFLEEVRDPVLEAVDQASEGDAKAARGRVDEVVKSVPLLGRAIMYLTSQFEEMSAGIDAARKINKVTSGLTIR